ncbi:hypothetical protein ACPWSR_13870 [Alloiococcus sp. CFN-8]|uniref:hypothetical protein n=1 Tax=Alloiococcus sp. CFN-8 TaxID=3416081 RepID=UPI003CFAADAA
MKCYYCEMEFSGNVCPKCMAVYSITEEESKDGTKPEEIEIENGSEKNKSKKGKKLEGILDVVDIIVDVVESILD